MQDGEVGVLKIPPEREALPGAAGAAVVEPEEHGHGHGRDPDLLRIGDGTGQAEFIAMAPNAIPVARSVTVEADGLFDISGIEVTFDRLTVNGGKVYLAGFAGAAADEMPPATAHTPMASGSRCGGKAEMSRAVAAGV